MSDTAPQKPQQDQSSGSGLTAVSRHPCISDPIASKRVCFYKSGDPQFSGLRLVINSRTFKTFDALLDSLSKKVPLPFGVRNITTPRGVHAVKTLEELRDGQSYICSDQKKVKPINLEMARKKLPPWYSARPVSARRRAIQLARQNMGRSARRENPLGVWTPKRLVVFRNGDPSVKHTVLLQRKTMQTFEALLDYMCEIMQFPVVKLYTADGRRVDGLPALILCSGAVVATGREPFKSGNYDLLKPSLPTRLPATSSRVIPNRLQPKTRKSKSRSSSSKSRNFSLSSEKYFVNQIQNSITGSVYDLPSNLTGSVEMDPNTTLGSVEAETCTCAGDLGEDHHLVPPDDDIEKSFRVNQDGSMTVEMKVRLTIKEEETVHWSTTLTRSSVANQLNMACLTQPEQDSCTPDSSTVPSKDNDGLDPDGYESKDENNILPNENGPICEEEEDETYGAGSEAWQPTSRRAPTPGPRSIRKKQASVESIKMETETGIQENVVGTYSYTEETVEGKVTEECCIVRQCNSKPIPKPRNLGSMEINNNKLQSTIDPSGVSEILHEEEITETVLHIYEQQSCHDNFFANTQFHVRSQCESMHGRPASTDTGLYSASNDFELDLRRPFTASESLSGRRAETLSLSSEPRVPACKNRTDLTTDYDIQTVANSERECAGSAEYLDIRHMLEKLSLSIQEIRQISEHRQPSCMEKSHSLPDFSSYVASTFGSSPQALLAFLSVMTLKEGISNTKTNEPLVNNTSCTEALKMMESLKKIASIEDADELKVSLSDLQKSTSSQLLQNWKSFQELSDKAQNHRLSSNFEHELSFETCQDQSYRNEEQPFDIQELVEELSTNTKLQEELSTLVNRKTSDVNMSEVPMENSEMNDTAESYPGERLNDLKESGVEEETINFIESNFEQEVGDYVKSIIQNVTSALIADTGSTVRVGTKKADFSALQQAEISKEPEGCTEEPVDQEKKQEGHEEEHNIYEEGTDRYAEQPLCYDENQGNFIEHSAICQGEELIHENWQWTCEVEQGSYVEKEVCCAEQSGCVEEQAEDPEKQKSNEKERANYVEEQVSYDAEKTSYVEQTGFVEEQKNDTGNKCSHEEQLAIYAEDQAHCLDKQCIYEEEQGCCQEDQGRSVKEQESKTEWPSSQDEQQLSPDEEQNCHENDHDSCVEEPAKQFNYEEEQNSYVNKHISYEKNESTYKEEKAACIGEQESFTEQCPTYVEKQSSYEDKQDSKDEQQAMHDEEQVRHMEEHFCYVEENQPNCEEEQVNKSTPHMHTTHSTEGSNQLNLVTEEAMVEDECVWNNVSQSVKILEELNNSLHPAPSASSLAFSYDSKGSLKREFEGTRVKSIRDLFLARSNVDFQYGHKQLPSPNTSDLSDYRPETSDSGGYRSQASLDTSTESGEDESGRRSIAKGYVRRTIERLYGRNDTAGKRPPSGAKAKRENRPGSNSVGSLTAFHEAKAKVITDMSYFNATSLYTTCNEPTQCIALKTNVDTKEGVLIDKGRWLLKENHLIRKSPPEDSAMQENGDSMSVETGPGYASDAAPYSHFGSHNPPLAVISSPELEDPGKTAVPNCTYFSLPHGSDSELFQDDLNVKTNSSTKAAKKDFQLSPATEEPKVCIEKNGSLPSFASVEFKKTGNKVHPQSGAPVVVTQPTRAQGATNSRAVQEQDPLEMLYLMCGQHCPIL
ncbi:oxygen-regulated protein 1-like [Anguilla anguilla]|uniref:oxygen-regulated protein 1-like n=1 Tax=Anguilla anguilla TaxID=7936 RepID=UPI0015ADE0C1|nr:oxygen-regulated protein 1-like [Anguilla anguilla]